MCQGCLWDWKTLAKKELKFLPFVELTFSRRIKDKQTVGKSTTRHPPLQGNILEPHTLNYSCTL